MIDRKEDLKNIEKLLKKFNESPGNTLSDRSTLKWLFLSEL